MYKNNEIILNNMFNNVDTMLLYEDLIINKKLENNTIYYSQTIRLNKNNTYKLPLFNYNYFDLLSDISIYYNKRTYIIMKKNKEYLEILTEHLLDHEVLKKEDVIKLLGKDLCDKYTIDDIEL